MKYQAVAEHMSLEEGLFDDIGIPERITSKADIRVECAREAWSLWTDCTERPDRPMPTKFRKLYIQLLDLKYPHDELLRCVRAASHIPPYSKDPTDTKRLLQTLNNTDVEAEALSLLDSGDAPIYKWQYESVTILCSAEDVAEACNIEIELWTSTEHEAAGMIVRALDRDELHKVAQRVQLHIGEEGIYPTELIRNRKLWHDDARIDVQSVNGRDTYGSGAKESDTLEGLDLDLDAPAENLLIQGCPAHLVRSYHLDVPSGYWDDVAERLEQNEMVQLQDIYHQLLDQYDWAPHQRTKPSW